MQRLTQPEIILALDVDTLKKAKQLVDSLYPKIKIFKVGSHLFTAYGPKVVEMLHGKGAQVFLDLKYLDIPNTVASAVGAATRLKVKMLTLHISGGREMLKAAVNAAKQQAKLLKIKKPLLVGVTVLTSQEATSQEVLNMARVGVSAGLDGVVCSVREADFLRKKINKPFAIVTPGIRMSNPVQDDQRRVATVSQAVRAGSNFLVIGRPILQAADPLSAAQEILGELYGARN